MTKKEKAREAIRLSTGDITQSAVAVGTGARAVSDVSNSRELSEAKARLAKLTELLEEQELHIEQRNEIRDEVLAIRSELDKKKPNFSLIRSTLKGIVVSLGPAQALATLAAQVLTIVRRLS
jgi:predicted RNA-binding protein with PIN domain